MRIALVSPLPPAPTGVADYTVRLLDGLRRCSLAAGGRFSFEAIDSFSGDTFGGFDACVYQIGNNRLHAAGYRAAIEKPGIVVLHDAVLHHLLLGVLSEDEYIEEFVYNYGEWYREAAIELWQARARCVTDERYFQFAMLRRIVEASCAVIVHNPKAARLAREALRKAERAVEVVEIPHPVETPPSLSEREIAAKRAGLGIPAEAVVISCFGYLRPPKRLYSLLQAMRMVDTPCRVLIAGDFVSPAYEASLRELLKDPRVVRLGHVPDDELSRLAAATDICVNLRYPSAGETSGIAMKLMAAGKPVLVTESEEYERFPELTLLRVDAGEGETEMLAHYLYALAGDAGMRALIGGNAAAYMREHHSLERASAAYLEVIRGVTGGLEAQGTGTGFRARG